MSTSNDLRQPAFRNNRLYGPPVSPEEEARFSDRRAKLTPMMLEAARLAHLEDPKKNSVARLAEKYGVTRATMHRAIERAGRLHVARNFEKFFFAATK